MKLLTNKLKMPKNVESMQKAEVGKLLENAAKGDEIEIKEWRMKNAAARRITRTWDGLRLSWSTRGTRWELQEGHVQATIWLR